LGRVLGDLSQGDPDKWSGEAAKQAANVFADLQKRYQTMKTALSDVRAAVDRANNALDRARAARGDLPSATVPSWIHGVVKTARVAGQTNVVINGYSYAAEKAVSLIENALGNSRDDKAHDILQNLAEELEVERAALEKSAEVIHKAGE